MSYAPDYGLMLQKTARPGMVHIFHSFRLYNISSITPQDFTILVEIPFGEQRYAASFDFSFEILLDITRLCSNAATISTIAEWYDGLTSPNTLEVPEPFEIGLEAKLGKLQSNAKEQYVPLIIQRVFKAAE